MTLHHIINFVTTFDLLGQLWPVIGCVAIWKPKGVNIARKYLHNSFVNNSDGAGFSYVKDGDITTLKGFFKFEDFYKAFQLVMKYAALIHFRIATHGKVSEENCHPFSMSDNKYSLVHNGVMPGSLHNGDKDDSDTRQFAEKLDTCINMVPFGHEGFQAFLEEAIGYNKVAIMRNDGKVWLLNSDKGEWHKGAWYSNHTYAYGAIKRIWGSVKDESLWSRLGAGTKEAPVWSHFHESLGYYDLCGKFHAVERLQGKYVEIKTPQNESCSGVEDAEYVFDEPTEENELSDEEKTELATLSRAALEGDCEFMPETEQERYVQRWLKAKSVESRTPAKGVVQVTTEDGGEPTAVNLDWEPGINSGSPLALGPGEKYDPHTNTWRGSIIPIC